MTLDDDNFVPQTTAANPDGGAAKLDPDPISDDTSSAIDNLLDEAARETNEPDFVRDTPDVTLDSISTGTPEEPVAETPVEAPTETPAPEITPKIELDPEILAIPQPRNLSESNQSNWRKLQETATTYKKAAEEAETLRQKVAELEQRTTVPQDYEELKKFKGIFDIKNDPEFKSRYETPISTAKEGIYGILRKNGAPDTLIKQIEDVGGPDKVDSKWWKDNAIDKLSMTDAERIKRGLIDIADLKEKQEGEIAHAATHAEEILAQRQVESQQYRQKEAEEINQHIESITKDLPWARYQTVDESMSIEQREKAEKHNANVRDLESKFLSALDPKTGAEKAAIAAAATFSHVLTNQVRYEQQQNATLASENKRLQAELSQLKSAGKMPKSVITTQTTQKPNVQDRIKMSASDAFDLGLEEAGG